METLVDKTQGYCGGGTGSCTYPALGPTFASAYQSATTYAAIPEAVWGVSFGNGVVSFWAKGNFFSVRAV